MKQAIFSITVFDPLSKRPRRIKVGQEFDLTEQQARDLMQTWKDANPGIAREIFGEYIVRELL